MSQKKKVFVGVSGGVDSSVAAYLLKKDGYDVHGVFVKTWSPEWLPCTWQDEKRDAMRVCAALDIPFHFLDAETEYKAGVADYMVEEYKAGRTPNPDVLCNRVIKFGTMWQYAKAHEADFIATGHYAQIVTDIADSEPLVSSLRGTHMRDEYVHRLKKGRDKAKDQSYFLWMLTNDDLSHTLFPIGSLKKTRVRKIAKKAGLFTASKKDSQGICFLGDVDIRAFLSHYIAHAPGVVINESGESVGQHDGATFYTLGERHGFTITEQSPHRRPYYIIGKDLEKNLLIVSHTPKTKATAGKQVVTLRQQNWLQNPDPQKTYDAETRYHGETIPALVTTDATVEINYDGVVALGQSMVLYDENTLMGGGIIHTIV